MSATAKVTQSTAISTIGFEPNKAGKAAARASDSTAISSRAERACRNGRWACRYDMAEKTAPDRASERQTLTPSRRRNAVTSVPEKPPAMKPTRTSATNKRAAKAMILFQFTVMLVWCLSLIHI